MLPSTLPPVPVGDPVAVQALARRLRTSAGELRATASGMEQENGRVTAAWEGGAQRVFSHMTQGMGDILRQAGELAGSFADALAGYALTLEAAQRTVRRIHRDIEQLTAAAAAGVPPDPVALRTLLAQADAANGSALDAARRLAATATQLSGGPANPATPGATPATASPHFVSQVHRSSTELTSSFGAQRSFDDEASRVRQQLLTTVGALSARSPASAAVSSSIVSISVPIPPPLSQAASAAGPILLPVRVPPQPSPPAAARPPDRADGEAALEARLLDNILLGGIQRGIQQDVLQRWDSFENTTAITRGFGGRNDPAWRPWPLPAGVDHANVPLSRRMS